MRRESNGRRDWRNEGLAERVRENLAKGWSTSALAFWLPPERRDGVLLELRRKIRLDLRASPNRFGCYCGLCYRRTESRCLVCTTPSELAA